MSDNPHHHPRQKVRRGFRLGASVNPILSAGLLIGVGCGIWTFVMGLTGWYRDPIMMRMFFLVVVFEIAGLIWGLRRTAAEGRGYGSQIVAGTMMAIVAGVVIICSSLLFTTVFFPDYFDELESSHRRILQEQGRSPEEIDQAVRENAPGNTPMNNALQGFTGTLITGIVASAVIAIFVRSRTPRQGPAVQHP
jgi:hypothetical protein